MSLVLIFKPTWTLKVKITKLAVIKKNKKEKRKLVKKFLLYNSSGEDPGKKNRLP